MEASTASAKEPPRSVRPTARATDAPPPAGTPAFLAELLGTFILVLVVTTVVTLHSGDALGVTDWAVLGLVHAFVLMLLVHTLGGTSGAHFNPAITIAMLAGRKIRPPDAVVYILVQLVGALAGALLTKLLLSNEGAAGNFGLPGISDAAATPAAQPGAPAPVAGPDFLGGSKVGGLAVEALGTFFLMWAIMATAVNPRGARDWAGFVIGATLGMAVMVFGPLTGGSFNPARWFGPAIAGKEMQDAWVYVIAPVIGAVLAYATFTAIVLSPKGRAPGDLPPEHLD